MKKLIILFLAAVIISASFIAPALADEEEDYLEAEFLEEDDPILEPEPKEVPVEPVVTAAPTARISQGVSYIEIVSSPSGATAIDLTTGERATTPCTFTIHEGTQYWFTSHTIQVSKSGYEDWVGETMGIMDDGSSEILYATLDPIAPVPTPTAAPISYGSAVINVQSSPSGATATDLTTGETSTTPCTFVIHEGTRYWGIPHTIQVSKSGYYDYSGSTDPLEDGDEYTFTPVLEPVSREGYISISSSPSGATIYIDGIYRGVTPLTVTENEGNHALSVTYPGYQSNYQNIYVYSGKSTPIVAKLVPEKSADGYIAVTSTPSGADVYIDGVYKGDTPVTVLVSPGSHNVKVVRSGYAEYTTKVSVPTGGTSSVKATLTASSSSYINVMSNPAGAAVYVDGVYKGNTQYSNYLTVGPFSSGGHTVAFTLDGYNKYTTSVNLGSRETQTLKVTLTPAQQTVKTASLYLATNPSSSEVYVDNIFRGYSPVILNDITPGPHIILVKHEGYNDWSETDTFTEGGYVDKTINLIGAITPVPTPTQSPAPVLAIISGLAAAGLFVIGGRRE